MKLFTISKQLLCFFIVPLFSMCISSLFKCGFRIASEAGFCYLTGETNDRTYGLVLEFFFFGGDYSRTERLEYEDDEYYYYVKAVPKATVAASHRKVKKISTGPDPGQEPETAGTTYANPIFSPDEDENDLDLERKLEESLRDL